MSVGDLNRHTFVVIERGDGRWMAYEEDKDGPAHEISRVPAETDDESPYMAISRLCQSIAGVAGGDRLGQG